MNMVEAIHKVKDFFSGGSHTKTLVEGVQRLEATTANLQHTMQDGFKSLQKLAREMQKQTRPQRSRNRK